MSALVDYDFEKNYTLIFILKISNKYVFLKCRIPVRIHGSVIFVLFLTDR